MNKSVPNPMEAKNIKNQAHSAKHDKNNSQNREFWSLYVYNRVLAIKIDTTILAPCENRIKK